MSDLVVAAVCKNASLPASFKWFHSHWQPQHWVHQDCQPQTVPRPEWAAVSMSYGPSGPQLAHPKLFAQKILYKLLERMEKSFYGVELSPRNWSLLVMSGPAVHSIHSIHSIQLKLTRRHFYYWTSQACCTTETLQFLASNSKTVRNSRDIFIKLNNFSQVRR